MAWEGILGGSPRVEMIPLTVARPSTTDHRYHLNLPPRWKRLHALAASTRVKPPRGFPDSPRWGDCSPSAMSPATLPTPIRVCILGLPRVGVHSAAFGHQVFQLQVLYSLSAVQDWARGSTHARALQFNAPSPGPEDITTPTRLGPAPTVGSSTPIATPTSCGVRSWTRGQSFSAESKGCGVSGQKAPGEVRAQGCCTLWVVSRCARGNRDKCMPIQTPIPDAGDIAAAEARAVQRVATAVSTSTAAMPTVVLRVPADQAIETHGDYRQETRDTITICTVPWFAPTTRPYAERRSA